MLIYLYGTDAYRKRKKIRELVDRFQKKYSTLTVERFFVSDGDEVDGLLRNFAAAQSLFVTEKLGIIFGLDELKAIEVKPYAAILKPFLEDKQVHFLVVTDKKVPAALSFLTKKPAVVEVFESPKGVAFTSFIEEEATRCGAKISPAYVHALSEQYAGDSWGVVTHLEMMALGSSTSLTMNGAIDPSVRYDFFPLVQSLKSPSSTTRVSALSRLLEREDPAAVFNVFASLVSPAQKPLLADYDVAIKSGKLEYGEALLELIL